jgi:sulfonate transport system substrate-binding protein
MTDGRRDAAWKLSRRRLLMVPLASAIAAASPAGALRVGDQRGGAKALMQAAGVLNDLPYKIEWVIFPAAAPLLEAMNADAIDTGGIGDAPFAFARAAGVPVKAIAATISSGASTAIVVPADAPFQDFRDLKGKRIGTGKGSVGHFLVLAALERNGMTARDIQLAFLQPADARAALAAGSIDAWSTWSQYVFMAVEQGGARILLDGRGLMSGLSYNLATEKAIASKHDLLADYTTRLVKAQLWGLAQVEAYAAVWAEETHVTPSVSLATLKARGFTPALIDAGLIADQQKTVDGYVKAGVLPSAQDAAAGFDLSFNKAAAEAM